MEKKLWFKRRWYGWDWYPASKEGWAVLCVYLLLVVAFSFTVDERSSSRELIFTFVLPLVFLTVTLIRICYARGEKPRWQWGKPKNEA